MNPKPYSGNSPYIFISYAHKDSGQVLPIVQTLVENGFRVWYDEGIEAGTEWPEYIEERLENSTVVLVFMTPAAISSQNCRNEINLASDLGKEMLVIYLQDTDLKNAKGMRLQLNSRQSLFYKNHSSHNSFVEQLTGARILQSCRPKSTANAKQQSTWSKDTTSDKHAQEKKVVIRPPEPEKMEPKLTVRQKIAEIFSAYDTGDIVMTVAILAAVIFGVVLAIVHCGIMRTDILSDVGSFELMKGSGLFKGLNDDVFTKIWLDLLFYALFLAATFVAARNCAYEELQTAIIVANIALPVILVLLIDPLLILRNTDGSDLASIFSNGKMYLTVVGVGMIRLAIPTVAGFFVGLFSTDS